MLFTGSSRGGAKVKPPVPRHHREQEYEEWILSPGTTKRQKAAAAMKRTSSGPQKPMSALTKNQFIEIRRANPYLVPKNPRQCPNSFFYHSNQERIYNEIYAKKEFNCCPQYSISMEKLESKPY
jgi:hypothetical protein